MVTDLAGYASTDEMRSILEVVLNSYFTCYIARKLHSSQMVTG